MKTKEASKEAVLPLPQEQKREILKSRISMYENTVYLNGILVGEARRLDHKQAVETLDKEINDCHKSLDILRRKYAIEGGKDESFEPSDAVKLSILSQQIALRQQAEYALELDVETAQSMKNQSFADQNTKELARVRGYLRALKKELKAVQSRLEKANNQAGAYAGSKAN